MKIMRLCIVLISPLAAVIFLHNLFSVDINFDIGSRKVDPNTLKQFILETLEQQEQKLELITPIVNPRWFLYQVSFANNMKAAIEATEPAYSEHETVLMLRTDKEVEIPYGQEQIIAHDVRREEILNKFEGYGFNIKPQIKIISGPNQVVKLEHSPLLGVASVSVVLTNWSLLFIYFLALIAWGGLIILAKPLFQFVYSGKQWWFKI